MNKSDEEGRRWASHFIIWFWLFFFVLIVSEVKKKIEKEIIDVVRCLFNWNFIMYKPWKIDVVVKEQVEMN